MLRTHRVHVVPSAATMRMTSNAIFQLWRITATEKVKGEGYYGISTIPIHILRLRSEPTHLNSAAPAAEATATPTAATPASAVKSHTVFLQRPNARGMPNTRTYKHRIVLMCYGMWCMIFFLCHCYCSQPRVVLHKYVCSVMSRKHTRLSVVCCEWELSRSGCSSSSSFIRLFFFLYGESGVWENAHNRTMEMSSALKLENKR